ncbi:MAG: hypothetical protein A2Y79_02865 [Deltaproteobacteria bacterium RBG_13_43_22]|nr:MAG: hypothetical protein A2Y79_02865 [Deltaproteobacteria bacterium RBG_13_43_22]
MLRKPALLGLGAFHYPVPFDKFFIQSIKMNFFKIRNQKSGKYSQKIFFIFLVILLLTVPGKGFGENPSPAQSPDRSSLFALGIEGYQKLLSPVLASQCPMQPSCSAYAKQALYEYGPFLGLLLTVDRLFHEANENRTSPLVRQGEQLKLYDPPSANVWWRQPPMPDTGSGKPDTK